MPPQAVRQPVKVRRLMPQAMNEYDLSLLPHPHSLRMQAGQATGALKPACSPQTLCLTFASPYRDAWHLLAKIQPRRPTNELQPAAEGFQPARRPRQQG
jgi:hypothetical protein